MATNGPRAARGEARALPATTVGPTRLRSALIGQHGKNANALLNDFGMNVPKAPGAKTVEAKAIGQAKSAATRTARHTMGSVQRKAVTGNVVGITVTPVVAGAPMTATAPTPPPTSASPPTSPPTSTPTPTSTSTPTSTPTPTPTSTRGGAPGRSPTPRRRSP